MMSVEMDCISNVQVFHAIVEHIQLDASSDGKASLIEPNRIRDFIISEPETQLACLSLRTIRMHIE
jgi:hypothetical protein